MGKAILGFLFVFVILGIAAFGLIVHEATHLALATEAHGVCFGVCKSDSAPQGWGYGAAWGIHNDLSRQEFLPIYFEIVVWFTGALIMMKSFKELSK